MDVKECVLSVSPLPTNDEISLDIDGQDVKDVQLNEQFGGGDDFAPKVRKPYTITKQRERWTEEEHKKFLEALKLYGRAWRRIEEHVGSKTAVQIRSHAQKFFSKVSRESNVGDGGSVKPVEIPPPRPKRKPMHPYPRKLVSPVKTGILIPERSVSPNLSPTSVLSVVVSDQSGGADSCVPNGSPSPVSSPAPAPARSSTHIFGSEAPKLLSEDVISSSQSDHEDENSSIDEEIPLDLDLSPRKTFVNEAATQSLKLFGKTLLVVDSSSSSCKTESFDKNKRVETCSYPLRVVPLKAASNSACEDAWRSLVEVQSSEMKNDLWYIQFTGDMMNSSSATALPWLTLASHSTRDVHNPTPIRAQSNEGSSSDSNTDSVGAATDGRGREEMSSFSSYKLSKRIAANCRRGFVPYKRCFTEQDSSAETVQEREKQRIRLCL